MGGERLYTGQPGPSNNDGIAPDNRSLGEIFRITQTGRYIVGGAVWIEATVYPERWQVWRKTGAVQMADHALAPLSPSVVGGTGWFYFSLAELRALEIEAPNIGPLLTGTDYVVNSWTPSGAGDYVFSGSTEYPFGDAPLSALGPIFRNGGTPGQIPDDETFTGGRFYVDVTLDSFGPPPRMPVSTSRAAQTASRW